MAPGRAHTRAVSEHPLNRRGIWAAITETRDKGGCCLLTTHLLEEAEALSSYLVILKKGMIRVDGPQG